MQKSLKQPHMRKHTCRENRINASASLSLLLNGFYWYSSLCYEEQAAAYIDKEAGTSGGHIFIYEKREEKFFPIEWGRFSK
jgi:hypothetical protein